MHIHQYQNLPAKNLSGFISYQFYFTFSLVTRAEKLYLGQHTTYQISKTFELFLWSRWKRGRVAVKIACDPFFVYVVDGRNYFRSFIANRRPTAGYGTDISVTGEFPINRTYRH